MKIPSTGSSNPVSPHVICLLHSITVPSSFSCHGSRQVRRKMARTRADLNFSTVSEPSNFLRLFFSSRCRKKQRRQGSMLSRACNPKGPTVNGAFPFPLSRHLFLASPAGRRGIKGGLTRVSLPVSWSFEAFISDVYVLRRLEKLSSWKVIATDTSNTTPASVAPLRVSRARARCS